MKMIINDIQERLYHEKSVLYDSRYYGVDLTIDGVEYRATYTSPVKVPGYEDEERFYCWKKSTMRYLKAPTKLSMVRSFVRDTIRELEA